MSDNLRDRLREAAAASASVTHVISEASAAGLFSKVAAIEACKANPYQPALVWHPTIFGSPMQLDLREKVAQEIFMTGAFEPDLLWFFSRVVDAGMNVIDAGAHIGFFTVALGQLVGPTGRVDAFEPTAATKRTLDVNIRNAALQNVFTHGLAVWSEPAIVEFNDWGHELSAFNGAFEPRLAPGVTPRSSQRRPTPATSLDAFVLNTGKPPQLVKLDVENAELRALTGMASMLRQARPIVVFEIGDLGAAEDSLENNSSYRSMKLLAEENYDLFVLASHGLTAHEPEDRRYEYGNMVALPRERSSDLLARLET